MFETMGKVHEMKQLAVIGDSHVNFFGGNEFLSMKPMKNGVVNQPSQFIDNFSIFHLGPALAFNLNKYNASTKAREKVEYLLSSKLIVNGQAVLCVFGEIDCRVHVILQAEKQQLDYGSVIDCIISNYLEFLLFLARDHRVLVWGPIPSQKDGMKKNPDFPYYGKESDRNRVTEIFNEKLEHTCKMNDIGFISIFKSLVDKDYKTKPEYIADGCHLSQRAWIFAIEEFEKIGMDIIFRKAWHEALWKYRDMEIVRLQKSFSENTMSLKGGTWYIGIAA